MKKNGDGVNEFDKKGKHGHHGKGKGEAEGPHHKWNKKGKHHKKDKHGKFSPKKNMEWLKVKGDQACAPSCKDGDVCIVGPIDAKPICVRFKDLKKSMKLFHKYQKKEMKAWRKFKKAKYHQVDLDTAYPPTEEEKQNLLELKKAHMMDIDSQGWEMHEKKGKHNKHHNMKEMTKSHQAKNSDEKACTPDEFSQMRSRLSGWFHVLHGVDHITKKADLSIKHFHKQSSVKKEMRQHMGGQCVCSKSSMWYFMQLDKDGNDHLSDVEMSAMEHINTEPCVQPYLTQCDQDADGKLSSDEWCCCFAHVAPPCYNRLSEIKKTQEAVTYVPRCDKEGYYMKEQCSGEKNDGFKCWCVDANGTELKGTNVEGGRAHCSVHGLLDVKTKSDV